MELSSSAEKYRVNPSAQQPERWLQHKHRAGPMLSDGGVKHWNELRDVLEAQMEEHRTKRKQKAVASKIGSIVATYVPRTPPELPPLQQQQQQQQPPPLQPQQFNSQHSVGEDEPIPSNISPTRVGSFNRHHRVNDKSRHEGEIRKTQELRDALLEQMKINEQRKWEAAERERAASRELMQYGARGPAMYQQQFQQHHQQLPSFGSVHLRDSITGSKRASPKNTDAMIPLRDAQIVSSMDFPDQGPAPGEADQVPATETRRYHQQQQQHPEGLVGDDHHFSEHHYHQHHASSPPPISQDQKEKAEELGFLPVGDIGLSPSNFRLFDLERREEQERERNRIAALRRDQHRLDLDKQIAEKKKAALEAEKKERELDIMLEERARREAQKMAEEEAERQEAQRRAALALEEAQRAGLEGAPTPLPPKYKRNRRASLDGDASHQQSQQNASVDSPERSVQQPAQLDPQLLEMLTSIKDELVWQRQQLAMPLQPVYQPPRAVCKDPPGPPPLDFNLDEYASGLDSAGSILDRNKRRLGALRHARHHDDILKAFLLQDSTAALRSLATMKAYTGASPVQMISRADMGH